MILLNLCFIIMFLLELRELVAQMSADIAEKNEIIKGLTFTKKKVEQELETKV